MFMPHRMHDCMAQIMDKKDEMHEMLVQLLTDFPQRISVAYNTKHSHLYVVLQQ